MTMRASKTKSLNLSDLEHYMFTKNHIMNLCFNINERNKPRINKTNKNKINSTGIELSSFFIPKEKDTLFWCYYIIVNGIQSYEKLFDNTYKEEKEQKLAIVENLNKYKQIMKSNKWKKTEIESDLAFSNEISVKTFFAICAFSGKNIALLKNRCLYTMINTTSNNGDMEGITDSTPIEIIEFKDGRFGYHILDKDKKATMFKNYSGRFWIIDNISKPMFAASAYKLPQLQEIAEKLKIPIVNEKGKKMKKSELYNLIKLKL